MAETVSFYQEMAIYTYYGMEFKTYIKITSRDQTVEAKKFMYIRMNIELCKPTKYFRI
jgi:hypothetical protein